MKQISALPALLVLAGATAFAQTQGVSNPPQNIDTSAAPSAVAPAKPSAAKPVGSTTTAAAANTVMIDGHQVVLKSKAVAVDPSSDASTNPDANIVTAVPSKPNELPEGTLLRVRMNEEISTRDSVPGSSFTARIQQDALKDGRVIIPAGSELKGRIMKLSAGRRIHGPASIRLRPDAVILPDGTRYVLHAEVIDTGRGSSTRTDNEGTIVDKGDKKKEAMVIGGGAGVGAVTGAVFAGGPGALIGAGVGAGAGTLHWLLQDSDAKLPKNSAVIFQLTEPMQITPLHVQAESAGLQQPQAGR